MMNSLLAMNDEINFNIRKLNSGGCGVYSWMVARALEQLPIISHASCTVITDERTPVDLNCVGRFLTRTGGLYNPTNWWDEGVHFNHVLVQYRPKGSNVMMVLDSESLCEYEEWANKGNTTRLGSNIHPGKIEWQVMRELTRYNHHNGWNTSYDRNQGRRLAAIVNRHLGC